MSDDINDDERKLEAHIRHKWMTEQGTTRPGGKLGPAIEYHLYSHQIADERGGADTYWRFDRMEGSESNIHREYNSKALAMIELEALRKRGFTVHVIGTPAAMTLEAKAESAASAMKAWQEWNDSFSADAFLSGKRGGEIEGDNH